MADKNWCLEPGASASANIITGSESSGSSGIASIHDNSEATYYGVGVTVPPGVPGFYSFTAEVDFGESADTISKVALVSETGGTGACTLCKLSLYYGGAWRDVLTIYSGAGANWGKTTDEQTGTWNNVTKIRVTGQGGCFSSGSPSAATLANYELRAWGPPNYIDIGLRIKTSNGIIKIGCKTLEGAHKLRIRKGGTTYGIPLLATDDASASGVRIFDGSTVKAIKKVT